MIPGAAFSPGATKPQALKRVHGAIRLAVLFLGLATLMTLPSLVLPVAVLAMGVALRWTNMTASQQLHLIKPWWPMALIVLTVHAITGCFNAGQLVSDGLVSGLVTLGRILLCLGLLSFFLRVTSLDETVAAVHFWCKPLRVVGVQTHHLGLVLAVALGTAPVVQEEGRRIQTVVRMRRSLEKPIGARSRIVRWWSSLQEWGHLVLPIMESLGRRADTLSLSLSSRMPAEPSEGQISPGPGPGSLVVVALWFLGLLWFTVFPVIRGLG